MVLAMSTIRVQTILDTFVTLYKTIRTVRTVAGKSTPKLPVITASSLSPHTIRLATETSTSTISILVTTVVYPMVTFSVGMVLRHPPTVSPS